MGRVAIVYMEAADSIALLLSRLGEMLPTVRRSFERLQPSIRHPASILRQIDLQKAPPGHEYKAGSYTLVFRSGL